MSKKSPVSREILRLKIKKIKIAGTGVPKTGTQDSGIPGLIVFFLIVFRTKQ